jgi:hypothetical protein
MSNQSWSILKLYCVVSLGGLKQIMMEFRTAVTRTLSRSSTNLFLSINVALIALFPLYVSNITPFPQELF